MERVADDTAAAPEAAHLAGAARGDAPDPRRWLTLGILILTVVLIALDSSVLNVSIPTILRELHTTVPALQWVITGYSLTFATLLIVGGRLGDIYGHRRLFMIGATLFGVGSLLASVANSVGVLILGEAVIEGVGAALMTPSTLAILSNTFTGRERGTAFAAWGAAAGAAVAFGPVLGGFLTTNYSWRWSFRINVVVAPMAVLGSYLLVPRGKRSRRTPIDLPGAALVASGMFLLVFALSDGGTYGWFTPIKALSIAGHRIWTTAAPISPVPVALVVAGVVLTCFVLLERSKERRGRNPLFEFSLMGLRPIRWGLLTLTILSMGQLAVLFALPLFLQDAIHLSAQENGLWLLPLGISIIVGAQVGGRLVRVVNTTFVVRSGLLIETASFAVFLWAVTPGITFLRVLPALSLFGMGIGFASSQMTGVILAEVPPTKSGVVSGASSTARQMGAAFGGAVISSIVAVQTTSRAIKAIRGSQLPSAVRDKAVAAVHELGPNVAVNTGADAVEINRIVTQALADATRIAMIFAAGVVLTGAIVSFRIPRMRSHGTRAEGRADQANT